MYGYTDRCIGWQHARLGLKPADHNEECSARIVRHTSADDNFKQRVQIAQERIVEIVEGSFSARMPRSSAEVRRVFIHDIMEIEAVGQWEQQGDQRDDEEGDEMNGDVEERQQSEQ